MRMAPFASSSIPFTSPASRPTKASTSFRPRSKISPRSMPCGSTRSYRKSSAPSPTLRMFSTCGDLSPDRRPRAGAHLRRRARFADPPRHRKEAQGRAPRSLRHRSPDGAQIRPRRRLSTSATVRPSDPSQPALIAPPWCSVPSASTKSTRRSPPKPGETIV
jgi:hypothetical protein